MADDFNIEIEGLDKVLESIENFADKKDLTQAVKLSCEDVVNSAKRKVPKGHGASGLSGSITYKVESNASEIVGTVFSPLDYAPYVEFGTGKYVDPTSGYTGRQGGWYIPIGNDFTEAQAKKYHYPIIREKDENGKIIPNGKKWAFTYGSHPHPFMRPALAENREKFKQRVRRALND